MNSNKLIKQIGFIPPPYGGVSIYVKRLTERLNKDGYITGTYYFVGEFNETLNNSSLYDPFEWLSTKKFFTRFAKLVKETYDYKIIHSHFGLESIIFLWSLKVFFHKKIIITVHNSWSVNLYASTNILNRIFIKLLAKTDTTWIAVSEEAKDQMKKLPIRFRDILVIPAFISNHSEYVEENILDKKLIKFLKQKKKVIVFYGHSFMNNNGADVYGYNEAIKMFGELMKKCFNDVLLVMCIGEDNSSKINNLRNFANEIGVSTSIYWQIGAIKDMNALWNYTDIYIRPTGTDGDSVSIREALSLGIQVVASDVCIRPQGTTVYHFGDISDFTNKVLESLHIGRVVPIQNDYYNEMLLIYKKILNRIN